MEMWKARITNMQLSAILWVIENSNNYLDYKILGSIFHKTKVLFRFIFVSLQLNLTQAFIEM